MPINENWNIRSRSHNCLHTGDAFADGETFYTALFEDPASEELVRRDYSIAAWEEAGAEDGQPFSFWKSVYEAPRNEAEARSHGKGRRGGVVAASHRRGRGERKTRAIFSP